MNKKNAVIVWDCGATNVRAVAVDQGGKILYAKSYPNYTSDDPIFSGGKIWNIDDIWSNLCMASRAVINELDDVRIKAVCVTSFGVDGAPFDKEGNQLYPVISWACPRTKTVLEDVYKHIPLEDLYQITGVHHFDFNTLYKIFWMKSYQQDVYRKMDYWLFMPSIFTHRLCGSLHTDVTMVGTSMMNDLEGRSLSRDILGILDMKEMHFPNIAEAGHVIGHISRIAYEQTLLPEETPVISAGHDTQFAIFGSGADLNQPVLSSGTWEVLMVRTPQVRTDSNAYQAGITTEYDVIPGLYNPGLQWLGSGLLEEIRRNDFSEIPDDAGIYDVMIREARASTPRGLKYLETLIELSKKTKAGLTVLEDTCDFKARSLTVVGGGSKNELWNDLRKEITGIDIKTIPQKETTVLGAAMYAFTGCGFYPSAEEARKKFLKH